MIPQMIPQMVPEVFSPEIFPPVLFLPPGKKMMNSPFKIHRLQEGAGKGGVPRDIRMHPVP